MMVLLFIKVILIIQNYTKLCGVNIIIIKWYMKIDQQLQNLKSKFSKKKSKNSKRKNNKKKLLEIKAGLLLKS